MISKNINVSITEYSYDVLIDFQHKHKFNNMDTALSELLQEYDAMVKAKEILNGK